MSIGEEFVYNVMGELANIFENVDKLLYENKSQFNSILRTQIHLFSKRYNLISNKDYMIGASEFIDVVWRGKSSNIVAAFIITDNFKDKIITELTRLDATYKFWLYYGQSEIPYMKDMINKHSIHIIRAHKNTKKIDYWLK